MSTPRCRKLDTSAATCVEQLADGWITPQDLCPACTRAFMQALDGITGPLQWHPAFRARAER